MGLTASGELVDGYTTVFLPGASGGDSRCTGGIRRQGVAKLAAAADQAIEVRQVSLDLCAQAFIHRSRLTLLAEFTGEFTGTTSLVAARIQELLTVRCEHVTFPAASGSVTGPVYITGSRQGPGGRTR